MLKKENRLTKKQDFQKLYKGGDKLVNRLFVLRFRPNQKSCPRFGVVISNKIDKKAHIRNRLKRQITEILRQFYCREVPRYDYVFVCLAAIKKANHQEIRENVENLFKKINRPK